jgi:superkiller protein 3
MLLRQLGLDPDDATAIQNLGFARAQQGRLEEAVADYERALALDPDQRMALVNLANAHNRLGHFEGATEPLRRALELDPEDAASRNNLAWRLATWSDASLRRPAEAVAQAERAVELQPDVGVFWNTLGCALYAAGEDERALAALERSAGLRDGGDADDWLVLGLACLRLGRADEARTWHRRSVEWMDARASHSAWTSGLRRELELALEQAGDG